MGSRIDASSEFAEIDMRIETAYNDACCARDDYEFKHAYRMWYDAKKDRHVLEIKVRRRDKDRERKRILQETDPDYRERRKQQLKKYRQNHVMTESQRELQRERNRRYRQANLEKVRERNRQYQQRKREEEKDAQSLANCLQNIII